MKSCRFLGELWQDPSVAIGPATELEDRWTQVAGQTFFARVSRTPIAAGSIDVVLVHGLAVSSAYMVPTALALSAHHRVFAPDLPGFGRSDKPRRVLSIRELADALAAWMVAVRVGPAALIGNSLGCQIIADFVRRHRALVERAVMIGPTMDPRGRTMAHQAWRLGIDIWREPWSAWIVQGIDYLKFGPRRLIVTLRDGLHDRLEAELAYVQVPTLVVRGERDPIVPQDWAEGVARLLPNGRLVVIPGAPHIVNFNAPNLLAQVVLPFLAERTSATPSIGRRSGPGC